MHMHLLETSMQKEYAWRRGGCTAVEYIDRFDYARSAHDAGPRRLLSEKDIARMARRARACVTIALQFPASLRHRGAQPLRGPGINTAIGLDEAGINDDRDMLQEMRLVLRAHRVPGIGDEVPTMAASVRMASIGGARTTGFGDRSGRSWKAKPPISPHRLEADFLSVSR